MKANIAFLLQGVLMCGSLSRKDGNAIDDDEDSQWKYPSKGTVLIFDIFQKMRWLEVLLLA